MTAEEDQLRNGITFITWTSVMKQLGLCTRFMLDKNNNLAGNIRLGFSKKGASQLNICHATNFQQSLFFQA